MYQELRNYLNNNSFKLTLTNNYLNIENYLKIIILEDNRIDILLNNNVLKIKGEDLKLKRIMNKELMITGLILELKLVKNE